MYESGLRTISQYANQAAHERLFLCLNFRVGKVFLVFYPTWFDRYQPIDVDSNPIDKTFSLAGYRFLL